MVDAVPVVSITEHLRDAYGFTMKSTANGFLFRVLPLRDPDQPRFWCIVVMRSLPGGGVDRAHSPWIGRRGLRREDLAETLAAIRDGLEAWLADPAQKTVRQWVMAPVVGGVAAEAGQTPSPDGSVSNDGYAGTGEATTSHGSPHLNVPSDHAGASTGAGAVA
jgi:hypothetical protein